MGLFDTEIRQFEMYNQPLVDDPNTADLIGPAVVAMRREEDFMDHVRLALVAILGRKDIHKFQNIIEDGVTPNIEFPDSNINLLVVPNAYHESLVPVGGECTGVRVGHMRVIDWINFYMAQNSVSPYQPCIQRPIVDIDDGNDGFRSVGVIGASLNATGTAYIAYALDHGAGENPIDTVIELEPEIPLKPDGIFSVVYYSYGQIDPEEPEGGWSEEERPESFERCGLAYYPIEEPDFSFGQEGGEFRTFPPLPLRVNNENYYAAFDEAKIDDIEKLGKIVGVDTGKLIDDVMEGAEEEGYDSKMDHVFLNFGTRIHDNSEASCRYLYLLFSKIREYGLEAGDGSFGFYPCWYNEIVKVEGAINPSVYTPAMCNIITIETDDYYYEFTFSMISDETMTVAAVLADEIMGPQYEDRANASGKFWYISSSSGDPSREEEYEQPPAEAGMWPEEGEQPVEIMFGECDGGDVRFIKIVGIGGKVRIKDTETGVVKMRRLNYDDPNSITVPYIPAIGEVLTNHELADNFLSGLHVSMYIADIETKSKSWWMVIAQIIIVIVVTWISYGQMTGATLSALGAADVIAMGALMIAGYIMGKIVVGISRDLGLIAGAIAALLAMYITGRMTTGSFASIGSISSSFSSMSLMDILSTSFKTLSQAVNTYTGSSLGDIGREFEGKREWYANEINLLGDQREELEEEEGGYVGSEVLIEDLINSSIRTTVNPMDASSYFDFYDKFHEIGESFFDTDNLLEAPFDMEAQLMPV